MAKDYLLCTLDQNCKSWAQAYLYKIFTAGIESTARVEGYNWIIKQQLKAKSTLCELANRLDSSNTIKAEMAECLFVNTNIIEPNDEDLSCEQETPHRSSDGFIEDQHDARFITLQTIIEEVGREEVLEIWKVVDIRSERKHNVHFVIIVNALSFLCSCLKSISKGIEGHS
ncbi:unnamed protein product [Rhizophagus irregularis]|nr:unnamed protein product [Rhizophagus irregularis]